MNAQRLSVPMQLVIGAGLALATYAVFIVLAVLGVPIGPAGWVVVFLAVWVVVFLTMRLRFIAMIVSFLFVEFGIYFVLAARDFRLWW